MSEGLPQMPAWATEDHLARYATVAALARRVTDRLPHAEEKTLEPGHGFDLHVRPAPAASLKAGPANTGPANTGPASPQPLR